MAKRRKQSPPRRRSEDSRVINQGDTGEQNEAAVVAQNLEGLSGTIEVRDADVISGINSKAQRHPGNVQYVHKVRARVDLYQRPDTSCEQQGKIIDQIIQGVQTRGGRFVIFDESGRLSLMPRGGKSGYREKVRKALGHPKKKPTDAKKKPSRHRPKRVKRVAKHSIRDQEGAIDGPAEPFVPSSPVQATFGISRNTNGGGAPDALQYQALGGPMTPNDNAPTPSSMGARITPSSTSSNSSEAESWESQMAHGPAPPFLPHQDDEQQSSASIATTQEPTETNQDVDTDPFEPIPYTPGDPLDLLNDADRDMIELLRELCWLCPDDESFF